LEAFAPALGAVLLGRVLVFVCKILCQFSPARQSNFLAWRLPAGSPLRAVAKIHPRAEEGYDSAMQKGISYQAALFSDGSIFGKHIHIQTGACAAFKYCNTVAKVLFCFSCDLFQGVHLQNSLVRNSFLIEISNG
jgi:hypothetical protein